MESPDINPIENMWHELNQYIKPKNKEELVSGILRFWDTVDVTKCKKYIGHFGKLFLKSLNKMEDQLDIEHSPPSLILSLTLNLSHNKNVLLPDTWSSH